MDSVTVDLAAVADKARMVRRDVARKTVNLREAKVVVTAGAGIGSRENMKLVEDLAAALKGEVAATRAAVDAGWVSAERQVGQTGVTVRPKLYVACGVSGAVQHRVGMMDSSIIVAINTDAAAPIFKIAHYRLLGDVKAVIPKLLKLLAQRRKES
jgi:electron transfer flavoprotein alpha subunit